MTDAALTTGYEIKLDTIINGNERKIHTNKESALWEHTTLAWGNSKWKELANLSGFTSILSIYLNYQKKKTNLFWKGKKEKKGGGRRRRKKNRKEAIQSVRNFALWLQCCAALIIISVSIAFKFVFLRFLSIAAADCNTALHTTALFFIISNNLSLFFGEINFESLSPRYLPLIIYSID
jgi:hypothetical protein